MATTPDNAGPLDEPGLTLAARRGGQGPATRPDTGRLVLQGEREWLLRGPAALLDAAATALGGVGERLAPDLLLLDFGNAVGLIDVPGLGRLEIVSGKWGDAHFERMLAELTAVAAGLPFAAVAATALPYDRSVVAREDVLYHLFVYLRHILAPDAPPERRLLPALALILREPHQHFAQTRRTVPAELARGIDPAGFLRVATGQGGLTPVGPAVRQRLPLAETLRGHLPERVDERHVVVTRDTPENRFVKTFLGQVTGIIERMRQVAEAGWAGAFRERVLRDCAGMASALRPVVEHPLWREVGPLAHLPAASQVLQRRRGYREVYGHFGRLRLATRLPLAADTLRDLLAVKDIASLYEVWCYFTLVAAATALLGPPSRADRPHATAVQITVPHELAVAWPDGTRLRYNPRFSRARPGGRRSYSVPLRPDIALDVPGGPHAGLHLLDAKFRLDRLDGVLTSPEADDETAEERAEERRGTFKRADLYKMHTYRDAIPGARSVWILYPGSEFRFFPDDASAPIVSLATSLLRTITGVGAAPLAPDGSAYPTLATVLALLLDRGVPVPSPGAAV